MRPWNMGLPRVIACLALLARTVCLFAQSNPAVVDAGVSIAFQNSDGATVQQGVSVAFQNSAYGTTGAGVTVFFQGAILVTTNLTSASFTISGPASYNGTGTLFNQPTAPAGPYTISFTPVSGYKTPAPQTQTLSSGGSIKFNGTYAPLPVLSVSPSTLTFGYQQQIAGPPSPQSLRVSSSGPALNFTAQASTTPAGGTWLGVSPTNANTGISGATLSVSINPLGLAIGTYTGQITVSSSGAATSPLVVPVTLTVVAQCAPPQNFYSDATGTGGFGDAAIPNIQIGQCSTQGSIQIQNWVAAWLGVVIKPPQTMSFAPDLNAGPAGIAATFFLVPPCSTNFLQCTSPALAQWVVTATASGMAEVDLEVTPAASYTNLADIYLGLCSAGIISVATVVNVGSQLYAAVPDFKAAADCLASANPLCMVTSSIAWSLNQQELQETEKILKTAGLNITMKTVVSAILKAPDQWLLLTGTLSAMYYQTTLLGHYAVEIIDVQAQ